MLTRHSEGLAKSQENNPFNNPSVHTSKHPLSCYVLLCALCAFLAVETTCIGLDWILVYLISQFLDGQVICPTIPPTKTGVITRFLCVQLG
jgi:hypothetical protein